MIPAAMPVPSSHTIEAGGLRLHYLEAGDGPPVVFLHGWPTSAQLWRHVLPAVGKTHRAIALDLPGFGRSDKPTDQRYTFGFFGRTLDAFMEALGLDRIGLVVHDLGGPVGLHWASRHPEAIRELGILNTLCFPELSWAVKLFVASTYLPLVRSYISSPAGVARAIRFGVVDKGRVTPQVEALYGEPFHDRDARKALLMAGQGLNPNRFGEIAKGLEQFREIPVRIVYGERDRILPDVAKTMHRVAAILPHAQVTAIPDCGHFLQEDRPTEVADHLAGFFAACT